MGFDFTNDRGTYLRFSPSGWALALMIGENYGWQPEGTTLPRPAGEASASEWSGEYATNEGQRVSASDANALAAACERALADPVYEQRAVDTLRRIRGELAQELGQTPEPVDNAEVIKFRERLKQLIAFCREGSFIIE